jgi:hypothetical protein
MTTDAKLYPIELLTIGILFSLKGCHFRAFYHWSLTPSRVLWESDTN